METIHVKTVDPISQDLLRAAGKNNIRLNWERFETMQPQDGFLRLGLSCPYGCLQGPCRIDPFGRGPDQGLCGLDRDGMVAAFLLRLVLQGVMEIAGGARPAHAETNSRLTAASMKKIGATPISAEDIFQSAAMLVRPAGSIEDMIRQVLRMGLFAVDLSAGRNGTPKNLSCRCGYGLMAGNPVVVAVAGQAGSKLVASLLEAAGRQTDAVYQVLSLGDWIPLEDRYLPMACTSGEAELLISSGRMATVLIGPGADPGIRHICQSMQVPVVESSEAADPRTILQTAKTFQSRHSQADLAADSSCVFDGHAVATVDELKARFEKTADRPLAMIGGSDMPHFTLGQMPVALAKALQGSDLYVAAWGDAAVWMIKDGLCSGEQQTPALVLEPQTGVVKAVDALQQLGSRKPPAGICFSGVKACRDLSMAVGLAAAGLRVAVASPIPIWGSENVRRVLSEQLAACGGELMHVDHPAQTEEMVEWFKKQS